jgi:hypothetical protein
MASFAGADPEFLCFFDLLLCAPGLPSRHDFHQWKSNQSASEHQGSHPHASRSDGRLRCGGTQAQVRSPRSVKQVFSLLSFGALFVCCCFLCFSINYFLFYHKFIH